MATEIQPFLNDPSKTVSHSLPDRHNRSANFTMGSAANRFDSLLETAHAHNLGPKPFSAAARTRQVKHSETASQSSPTSQADQSAREERAITHAEHTPSEKVDQLDDAQDEESTKAQDISAPSDKAPPDMLLAAGLVPQASTDGQGQTALPTGEDSAQAVRMTPDGVQSTTTVEEPSLGLSSTQTTSPIASAIDPIQSSGQTPADGPGKAEIKASGGSTTASDSPAAKSAAPDPGLLTDSTTQGASVDISGAVTESQPTETRVETDKTSSSNAAPASRMMAKPAITDAINQNDPQSPFEAVVRTNDVTAGPGTSGAEQFFSQDQPSSESRNGSDHTKSNLLHSDDVSLRPQFLDQTTGVSPSAPPAVEGRLGKGEVVQPAAIHGPERINDVPGGMGSAHSVTLDLDPLDMGPLRVRVMMSDQIVHTHIRTEHGELGQGLLQQGSSLEASLRTTGFEMGTLRVTVDQHQQGRGESPWAFQQQQGRGEFSAGTREAAGEENRASRAGQNIDINGRVSWIA